MQQSLCCSPEANLQKITTFLQIHHVCRGCGWGKMRVSQRLFACLASCLLLHATTGENERYIEDTDRFPGWKGELPSNVVDEATKALSQHPTGKTVGYGENGKVGTMISSYIPVSYAAGIHTVQASMLMFSQLLWASLATACMQGARLSL